MGQLSYVEAANTSSDEAAIVLEVYGQEGGLVSSLDAVLPAKSQAHFRVDSLLIAGSSGSVKLRTSSPNAVIAHVMQYLVHPQTKSCTSAYSLPLRQSHGGGATASFNLFLGQFNWLKLYNTTAHVESAVIQFRDGSPDYRAYLWPKATREIGVHDRSVTGLSANTYGRLTVNCNNPAAVAVELLRLHVNSQGIADWAMAAPAD